MSQSNGQSKGRSRPRSPFPPCWPGCYSYSCHPLCRCRGALTGAVPCRSARRRRREAAHPAATGTGPGPVRMRRRWAPLLAALLAAAAVGRPSRRAATDLDVTPRTTVTFEELSGARRFSTRSLNYSTLLLEEERGVLYVGARGAVFALNARDVADGSHRTIHWEAPPEKRLDCLQKGRNNKTECFNHVRLVQRLNGTHLYACGTFAFHPLCAAIDADRFTLPSRFEEGKEKCPYDPARGYTGLIVDGGLYTATRYEFRSLPDIRRNLHQRPLKTEESPLHWLNDAEFVASVLVRESQDSPVGDDDKIYYFFTERAGEETTSFFDQSQAARVARVARVCKSDLGGKKILQRKWTSFLKARLVCHIPYYEVLRGMEASAVCRYRISEVQRAFEGPYMEYQESARKWSRYEGSVPEPRPGSCITDGARRKGYNSSQDLPNSVLDFVKLHPLLFDEVKPAGAGPLLLKRNVAYSRLAVDRVRALDGRPYDVLFMGTADGWIHKAVVLDAGVHIIEELQVFPEPQPVESLVISRTQWSLYVGAASGILQLPLASCARYSSCYDCVLARDPYCAWDGQACRAVGSSAALVQDVQQGNEGCRSGTAPLPPPRNRTVLRGDDVLLPCEQRSNLARAVWLLNGSEAPGAQRVAYVSAIAALVGLCVALSAVLLHVSRGQRRRGKYVLGEPRAAGVELQTVSANCLRKGRGEDGDEAALAYGDGCLQIIPGEAPTAAGSPGKEPPAAVPPPAPPLPSELTNGVGALPNVLRKMNGNSYMLLQQHEEPLASPLGSASFAEELSRMLEKRSKHTQLVDKLDESSV
uniref:Semaphorin 4G n=1 Tax=Nothoprocta perdicaria TaxID=30464 RepID=A0A8C6ZH46_NOTPE